MHPNLSLQTPGLQITLQERKLPRYDRSACVPSTVSFSCINLSFFCPWHADLKFINYQRLTLYIITFNELLLKI